MNTKVSMLFQSKTKVYTILVLIPLCLYFKSLFYDFSPMDDQWLIIRNAASLSNWENLPDFFTKPTAELYYRPLLSVSLMIDYHISHLSPYSYHFTNLLLHILCVVLLFNFLKQLNVDNKLSFLLSILFAVHPVLLHSVAWIPGRNDSLLTAFTLVSFITLNQYVLKNNFKFLIIHFLAFVLALLTKENAFLLPIFFLTLCYNKIKTKQLLSLITLWLVIVIAWFIIKLNVVNIFPSAGHNVILTIKNSVFGYLIFIGKSVLPFQLSVAPTYLHTSIIPGIIVLLLFTFLYFKFGFKNARFGWLGIVIFFVMLIIPIWYSASSISQEHYEHRAYLPLVGIILFISQLRIDVNAKIFNYLILIMVIAFSLKTFQRMEVYKNEETFLDAGIKEAPENYFFQFKNGDVLYKNKRFTEALIAYNKALEKQPGKIQILNNRGNVFVALGKKREAIIDFNNAIKLSNSSPQAYLNRCLAYNAFGEIENAMNDLIFLKSNHPDFVPNGLEEVISNKWNVLMFEELNQKIAQEPQNAILYVNRAKLFLTKRMGKEALSDLKKACELEPNNQNFKNYFNELNSSFPH